MSMPYDPEILHFLILEDRKYVTGGERSISSCWIKALWVYGMI